MRLNREIKAWCPDFNDVRNVLSEIGATLVARKEQVDYFFQLPDPRKRLKLRLEDGRPQLIYYCDHYDGGRRHVEFQVAHVGDPTVKEVVEAALGVRVVVRKQREVWTKGGTKFHLDRVQDVGDIFEVEIEAAGAEGAEADLARYRKIFAPYLGGDIEASNEDLVLRKEGRWSDA